MQLTDDRNESKGGRLDRVGEERVREEGRPPTRAAARPKRIAASLAAATCSLLGAVEPPAVVAQEGRLRAWRFDTALHHYGESDRVTDNSFRFLASRLSSQGRTLAVKFAVDSLTGASASGAVPATAPQTFTSPSGRSSYTTPAGETPLDPSFLDTRIALDASWGTPIGRASKIDFGLTGSYEHDYIHAGINARYARELGAGNTTLNFGAAYAADTVGPEGGAPMALTPMLPERDLSNRLEDQDKTVTDFLFGVTQVLGRRTIGQFNYSLSHASGYLTDPYKLLSVVDPVTGDPAPGPEDLNLYRFEGRPDSRTKHSLWAQVRHSLGRDIVDVSYRFMTDDWGINSHTIDVRYRWMALGGYLQPRARYYTQTRADFYRRQLFDGDPVPDFASADYRLGDMDAYTVGVKYGRPFGDGHEWSLRIEYYNQSGRAPPGSAVGSLEGFDLYPTVEALIAQTGFRW